MMAAYDKAFFCAVRSGKLVPARQHTHIDQLQEVDDVDERHDVLSTVSGSERQSTSC